MQQRSALVLGATGLVGQALLALLLREPNILSVRALVRRVPDFKPHDKLQSVIVDFEDLDRHADAFAVNQVFCALGTTMRQAGTREQFRHVDHDFCVMAARLSRERGATQFLLVSALGANSSSGIFYNRVKGDTENDIRHIDFPSLTIARPSLLQGPRRELRVGERIGNALGRILPAAIRPIPASDVAAALTLAARESRPGVQILTSRDMRGAAVRLSHS
jgi:uncharacterized protein YbjT (DUF2867 family)